MRILITGAGGQVGTELCAAVAAAGHEPIATSRAELELGDRDSTLAAITFAAPDAIVHAGAWTAVDDCESHPDKALQINALGTRFVAEAARVVDAQVCYLSTDYVFDGTKHGPYTEWDEPAPRSVYGRSKLAGERELDPGSLVVRTSWVCSSHGANMVKTILRLAGEHERLTFVDDQRGHPTFARDLAAKVLELLVGHRSGTFHVTNQGEVSWFQFAQAVLEAAGDDPSRVDPVTSAEFVRPAPRPANSVLDNAALRLSGLDLLADFREPLATAVAELQS
jgi:dTDP-4-dehydrorhamnose reductase